MAMNPNTYTVKSGDTLSEIAQKYRSAYNTANSKSLSTYQYVDVLAAINNIPNKNRISIGQVIKLEKAGSGTSTKKSSSSKQVTKNIFGLQSDVEKTLLATWTWSKNNTDKYSTQWAYYTKDKVWFYGDISETKYKYSTFSIPENATRVRFRAKPVSTTYTKNNKTVSHWTAEWTPWEKFDFFTSNVPPAKPGQPSIKIDNLKLTASLSGIDSEVYQIKFQLVKNNSTSGAVTSKAVTVKTTYAEHTFAVAAGNTYKVRCQAVKKNGLVSEWSDYSDNKSTQPIAPKEITSLRALSDTSIEISCSKVNNADSYDIQYTTDISYFDTNPNEVKLTSIDAPEKDNKIVTAKITGMESGKEYFFRVRAVSDNDSSAWCPIKSIKIGKAPIAPSTWSSTTTVIAGEPLTFFWVHNAEDGSAQTYAELELTIGTDPPKTYTLKSKGVYNINSETSTAGTIEPTTEFTDDDDNKTNSCVMDTTGYVEGAKIQWRIRTAGITKTYGDWSVQRTVDVYTRPSLELRVTNENTESLNVIESFPFYISGLASPTTQTPTGYHLSIMSNEFYETVDALGNDKTVNEGEAVYSKYFDISTSLLVIMSAGNIDLQNGVTYTAKCTVSMDSGLTAEAEYEFTVSWTDVETVPNAEIGIDTDSYSAVIRPYCEESTFSYHVVTKSGKTYTKTDELLTDVFGEEVRDAFTTTGEQVYSGTSDEGTNVYYCMVYESTLVEGVTLSVYRREFDGTFTEIATGLANTDATYVTDPHPALDYARYRIVATTDATGAVSYYDIPNYPVGGKAVIIQWDEVWSSFNSFGSKDELVEPNWSGSLLQLPYNIDVSDKYSPDVALVEYIGRKRPVSYFGTQLGESSSWSVVIDKNDEETLYALRRLSIWPGNAYVREPSGTGYWAKVTVSFSQKHNDLTIPVSLDITRVEGGM